MGNDLMTSLSFAASGMETQAMRLRHVSENIANADTPGYHRKVMTFAETMETGLVEPGKVRLDQSDLAKIYDPGHPLAVGAALVEKGALEKAKKNLAKLQSLCGDDCPETVALQSSIARGPSPRLAIESKAEDAPASN